MYRRRRFGIHRVGLVGLEERQEAVLGVAVDVPDVLLVLHAAVIGLGQSYKTFSGRNLGATKLVVTTLRVTTLSATTLSCKGPKDLQA